jgi:5-oxoprolinase (ATP-hydrolysing) subunit A
LSFLTIDINADMGESRERLADGSDAELMRYITSANIACGGHAGDSSTMEETLELAKKNKVAPGAHPSYPDRAGFGRKVVSLTIGELQASITDQMNALQGIARRLHATITHVKPHGALYHSCNEDEEIARAVARSILAVDAKLVVVGQAGFRCLDVYRQMGLHAAAEAFADRRYEANGRLRSRSLPGALFDSAEDASSQAVEIAARRRVITAAGAPLTVEADTVCIHSDTKGAAEIARAVRHGLIHSGIAVRAF